MARLTHGDQSAQNDAGRRMTPSHRRAAALLDAGCGPGAVCVTRSGVGGRAISSPKCSTPGSGVAPPAGHSGRWSVTCVRFGTWGIALSTLSVSPRGSVTCPFSCQPIPRWGGLAVHGCAGVSAISPGSHAAGHRRTFRAADTVFDVEHHVHSARRTCAARAPRLNPVRFPVGADRPDVPRFLSTIGSASKLSTRISTSGPSCFVFPARGLDALLIARGNRTIVSNGTGSSRPTAASIWFLYALTPISAGPDQRADLIFIAIIMNGRLGRAPYRTPAKKNTLWQRICQARHRRHIAWRRRCPRRAALLAGAWKNLFAG